MELIDKSAVIAEIERRMQELHPTDTHKMQVGERLDRDVLMWLNALTWVKNFINSIEMKKEVDLVKEYDKNFSNGPVYSKLVNRNAGIGIAKHFFNLGLKQKGE